ncbi:MULTISPECIES: group 1 truncated hemoglobin [Pseudidiomarina]|uniref:Truncated hemoglobin YjbI n=2 Tax=Pseudidiomarina TaxID=2800384 RepID=A0A368V4B9_9GAMM|nr:MULTISPECIES: group 1 truncated hemoglobin [Pseudidiomarina]PWW16011.1 truncated hemoglobin YjbI [Pseudidiomarina maritima]RBP93479.1 truncated hemoglobin YjbI [Pseudidiomarina tainanensis]RCW35939.1 truncated hemoglobin YjbI [Pseudidiomarina tainanensis]
MRSYNIVKRPLWVLAAVLAGSIHSGAVAHSAAPLSATIAPTGLQQGDNSLYLALGEYQGLSQLMEAFVLAIAVDERVIHHFERVDIERFHQMLTLHLCELTGGPCEYTGADMVEVHRGMRISSAEFNAVVENLITAMQQQQLSVSTQNRLLAILAAMQHEIVYPQEQK